MVFSKFIDAFTCYTSFVKTGSIKKTASGTTAGLSFLYSELVSVKLENFSYLPFHIELISCNKSNHTCHALQVSPQQR